MDEGVTAGGILIMQLAAGEAGRWRVIVKGKKQGGTLAVGVMWALAGSSTATSQVHCSDASQCFGVALPIVIKDDDGQFRAM